MTNISHSFRFVIRIKTKTQLLILRCYLTHDIHQCLLQIFGENGELMLTTLLTAYLNFVSKQGKANNVCRIRFVSTNSFAQIYGMRGLHRK